MIKFIKQTLGLLVIFSFFSINNIQAYSITSGTVNTHEVLTKSLWNLMITDLNNLAAEFKFVDGDIDTNAVFTGGNVGIGMTNPNAKLDVDGEIRIRNGDNTLTHFNYINTNKNYIRGETYFQNGNVGIGTITPGRELDIAGTEPYLRLHNTETGNHGNGDFFSGIEFYTDDPNHPNLPGVQAYIKAVHTRAGSSHSYADAGLAFGTINTSGVALTRMTIDHTGNVGIGTINPETVFHTKQAEELGATAGDSQLARTLEMRTGNNFFERTWLRRDANGSNWLTARIHNGLSIDTSYSIPGSTTRSWWERDPYNDIQSWGQAGNTYLTIKSGNVGIGTTTPNAKLSINRPSGEPSIKSSNGYMIIDSNGNYTSLNHFVSDDVALVNGGGNVGIGTTTPEGVLDVKLNSHTNFRTYDHGTTLVVDTSGGWARSYKLQNDNDNIAVAFGAVSGNAYISAGFDSIADPTGYTSYDLIVKAGGNVGIGVPIPSTKLEVNGDVTANAFLYTSDERVKENIRNLDNFTNILNIEPKRFDWKKDKKRNSKNDIGVIAQDVEQYFPEFVNTDDNGYKSVDYPKLVIPLIGVVKTQNNIIQSLEKRIQKLEDK